MYVNFQKNICIIGFILKKLNLICVLIYILNMNNLNKKKKRCIFE